MEKAKEPYADTPYDQRQRDWMEYGTEPALGPERTYERDPDHNRAGYLVVIALAGCFTAWALHRAVPHVPPTHVPAALGKVCTCPCPDEPSTHIHGLDSASGRMSPGLLCSGPRSQQQQYQDCMRAPDTCLPPAGRGAPSTLSQQGSSKPQPRETVNSRMEPGIEHALKVLMGVRSLPPGLSSESHP